MPTQTISAFSNLRALHRAAVQVADVVRTSAGRSHMIVGLDHPDELLRKLQSGSRQEVIAALRETAGEPTLARLFSPTWRTDLTRQLAVLEQIRSATTGPESPGATTSAVDWFAGSPPPRKELPTAAGTIGRMLVRPLRNPGRTVDPTRMPTDTRVEVPPPPVRSPDEGTNRLVLRGWEERTAALREWAHGQLAGLPQSEAKLEELLQDIQWFRAELANHLEGILPDLAPADQRPLAEAVHIYQEAQNDWVQRHKATTEDLEFLLERTSRNELLERHRLEQITDKEVAERGLSLLTTRTLGLYDATGQRAPIQALPESTAVWILENNEILKETPEAKALLEKARNYYKACDKISPEEKEEGKKVLPGIIREYVEAMRNLLDDPVRARAFLVDLSFIDTVRKLLLKDPDFAVEKIFQEHAEKIFPPDEREKWQKAAGRLSRTREELKQAWKSKKETRIARAKQAHDNVLAEIVFHLAPRFIPVLLVHPRFDHFNFRHELLELGQFRRNLYRERNRLAAAERHRNERIVEPITKLWSEVYDPGAAELYEKVFGYLIRLADEMMERVGREKPDIFQRHSPAFLDARKQVESAIQKFREEEMKRLGKHPEGKKFNPRDYNRAIEGVLGTLLGTKREFPTEVEVALRLKSALSRLSLRKKKKKLSPVTPGLLGVAIKAMEKTGAKVDPVVPLFATFASKFRGIGPQERKEVSRTNPASALFGITGRGVEDYLAGRRRGEGAPHSDSQLLRWAGIVNNGFHDLTFVADPLTAGILSYWNAPVIDSKHLSWGADFSAMLALSGLVSPKKGDPIRMQAARIIAKANLTRMIPVMGRAIQDLAILISDYNYRWKEIRAAQAVTWGDIDDSHARPGPRPVGLFAEVTMPVPDALNPFDPTLEGALGIAPISTPLPPIGRGAYIALTAEAITAKPQVAIWPSPVGSFATYPKPDNRLRLYRGQVRMVVPNPVFLDALPSSNQLDEERFARFLQEASALQRTRWWLDGITPENIPPAPQEAHSLAAYASRGEERLKCQPTR